MKPLLVSFSDIEGGAAKATNRLHRGLCSIGVESQILVQHKLTDDKTVVTLQNKIGKGISKLKPHLDALPLKFYPQRDFTPYSLQWLPDAIPPKIKQLSPDIINLHWICQGFARIENLVKLKKPIVWTLHDMWAFTGGCHYSGECDRYTDACGACPQLHSSTDWDLSRWVWQRKAKAWKNLDLTIVTPSSWLAKCASSSFLFKDARIEVIPNGIDTNIYKPIQRTLARTVLNLPQDKQLVLFGAMGATSDRRKGFHLLQPALISLSQSGWSERIELVVFSSSQPSNPPELGFKSHFLGKLNDDISLALAYAAADLFVAPSIEDNLPNTVMEALACGTPCVAFNIGGMHDMIEHEQNGYLARPFEFEDLAKGIAWVLQDEKQYKLLSDRARGKVEIEFRQEMQANRYLSLFEQVLELHKRKN